MSDKPRTTYTPECLRQEAEAEGDSARRAYVDGRNPNEHQRRADQLLAHADALERLASLAIPDGEVANVAQALDDLRQYGGNLDHQDRQILVAHARDLLLSLSARVREAESALARNFVDYATTLKALKAERDSLKAQLEMWRAGP